MKIKAVTIALLMGFLLVFSCACDGEPEKRTAAVATPSSPIIIVQPTSTGTAAVDTAIIPSPTDISQPTPSPVVTSQPVADPAATSAVIPEQSTTPTPTITPIPTVSLATPAVTPLPTSNCQRARDDIQAALDAYHEANGDWPTVDGQPGADIVWAKLVPDLLEAVPALDETCEWQVESNPEGAVCLLKPC